MNIVLVTFDTNYIPLNPYVQLQYYDNAEHFLIFVECND